MGSVNIPVYLSSKSNLIQLEPSFTGLHLNRSPPYTIHISFAYRQACDAQVICDIRNDQRYKPCICHKYDNQYYVHKFLSRLW